MPVMGGSRARITSTKAIEHASTALQEMEGHALDVINVRKPASVEAAVNLARIVSKLSPILGNLIEFTVVEKLNEHAAFRGHTWVRQDPDFPDALLTGISPETGFEIKAWFPFATEITGRFKESQARLSKSNIHVCLLAWLPTNLVYGTPRVLDVGIFPALSVAQARDEHYHQPPRYVVVEPEDTTARTRNLQQTNTNGFRLQGSEEDLYQAEAMVESWGSSARDYSPERDYQRRVAELTSKFTYRGDTNYAKIDRIDHAGIEAFKRKVLGRRIKGHTVDAWRRMLTHKDDQVVGAALADHFEIGSEV